MITLTTKEYIKFKNNKKKKKLFFSKNKSAMCWIIQNMKKKSKNLDKQNKNLGKREGMMLLWPIH